MICQMVQIFNKYFGQIKLKFGQFTGGDLANEKIFTTCLEGRDSLVHTFKLNVKVLGDHNISVTAGLDKDYNATCGPDILVNLRYIYYNHRRIKTLFDNKLWKF